MADLVQQPANLINQGALHPVLQQIDKLNRQYGQGQPILIDGEPPGQVPGESKDIGDDIVKLAQDGVNESIR